MLPSMCNTDAVRPDAVYATLSNETTLAVKYLDEYFGSVADERFLR